jgi:hypothetical protein
MRLKHEVQCETNSEMFPTMDVLQYTWIFILVDVKRHMILKYAFQLDWDQVDVNISSLTSDGNIHTPKRYVKKN